MTIDNTADIIDSREIIERIDELEALAADGDALLDYDERCEMESLRKLADQCQNWVSDWEYGETLIRDSYFVEYAQQLADDIGAIDVNASWPMSCINWERAARELRMDYTAVDFDGVTYWVR